MSTFKYAKISEKRDEVSRINENADTGGPYKREDSESGVPEKGRGCHQLGAQRPIINVITQPSTYRVIVYFYAIS